MSQNNSIQLNTQAQTEQPIQTNPGTEINPAAYNAALKRVREIEENQDFYLKLKTDEFKPRARCGESLIMRRDVQAEDGDIVAIGSSDNKIHRVEWYQKGMQYYAVCIGIHTQSK